MTATVDTLIVGAGAAGLMAACDLARAGQRVVVVEARDRIGGRILTQHASVPLELGAEFVHGLPEVTWSLLREAGLVPRELAGVPYRYHQGPVRTAADEPAGAFDTLDAMSHWLSMQPPGTDLSFERYLQVAGVSGTQAVNASSYVEGFNAADRARISVVALVRQQAAEDAIATDRMFHVPGGYDTLPRFLADELAAAGGDLRLSHPVQGIEWKRNAVHVQGAEPDFRLAARRIIVTVPLGVLKANAVRFAPLPPRLRETLSGLDMGAVLRMAFLFRRPFWSELAPDMLFLFSPEELVPTWWTAHPGATPQITGWIGGAAATARAAGVRGDALLEAGLEQLARMFCQPVQRVHELLVKAQIHDWMEDPWARGAYSYAVVGGADASARLSQPVEDTLYFAGEHTDTQGHWGTVHAALASGRRAARDILSSA